MTAEPTAAFITLSNSKVCEWIVHNNFTVTAADGAGNTPIESAGLTVACTICQLYCLSKPQRVGRAIPLRLQFCDAAGANVSAADAIADVTYLTRPGDTAPGDLAESGNRFDGQYG